MSKKEEAKIYFRASMHILPCFFLALIAIPLAIVDFELWFVPIIASIIYTHKADEKREAYLEEHLYHS
ncbi:hypothetical protein [Alkalicoccobacillus plakortidis]|uniref:Uncharacterized protein n=1 Tax=Alkalicoccobacillus plakortidis TaxID=444060 RepID=A0ABT0XED0_9BACI|nr:hypothetical protein [Alkalicoccobacillus plakortidis]MCM2674251.1 hypothetical protein [Alkalicoccobacillus plakortidis]